MQRHQLSAKITAYVGGVAMWRRPVGWLVGVVLLGGSGCVQASGGELSVAVPLPVSPGLESRAPDYRVPERAGQLTRAQVDSLGSRIRSLQAEPTALTVVAGDTLRLPEVLRVMALDSSGAVLGELPSYDFTFGGRGMRLLADGRFVFQRAGRVRFTATLPEWAWRGPARSLPSVTVPIAVSRNGR